MKLKNSPICTVLSVLMFLALASSAMAQGGGVERSRDYILERYSMSKWRVGAYARDQNRKLETDSGAVLPTLNALHTFGEVGYSVVRWLTVYGSLGYTRLSYHATDSEEDTSFESGVAVKARLLDHRISDPRMVEDWVRIDATLRYNKCESDYSSGTLDWTERQAALMVSLVKDCEGNPFLLPKSIVLRAGPMYSGITGDYKLGGAGTDVDEAESFGLGIGLELYFNDNFSLDWEHDKFDGTTTLLGLNFRF